MNVAGDTGLTTVLNEQSSGKACVDIAAKGTRTAVTVGFLAGAMFTTRDVKWSDVIRPRPL